MYSAACPGTGDIFSLILPGANTECMQVFPDEFEKYRSGKASVMLMDNAVKSKVSVEFLPPHSPGLNPVEQ